MLKKLIVLGLVVIVSVMLAPFAFGLWNENLAVSGQLIAAENKPAATEQAQADIKVSGSDSAASAADAAGDKAASPVTPEAAKQQSSANADALPKESTDPGNVKQSDNAGVKSGDTSSAPEPSKAGETYPVSGSPALPKSDANKTSAEPRAVSPSEPAVSPVQTGKS